jgi:hypothetical protein
MFRLYFSMDPWIDWVCNVLEGVRHTYKIVLWYYKGKAPVGRPVCLCVSEVNIKMNLAQRGHGRVDWIYVAQRQVAASPLIPTPEVYQRFNDNFRFIINITYYFYCNCKRDFQPYDDIKAFKPLSFRTLKLMMPMVNAAVKNHLLGCIVSTVETVWENILTIFVLIFLF